METLILTPNASKEEWNTKKNQVKNTKLKKLNKKN